MTRLSPPAALAALLTVSFVCLARLPAAPAAAQVVGEPQLELRDRVLAVVDEDPILSSDVDRVIALGLVERREGETDLELRRRVLEILVEQRVRLHEVTRFGFEQVEVEAIERQVAAIRERFPDDETFRERLDEVGMDLQSLRQLVARQLIVWSYFEEVLGPRIFVSLEDTRTYYEEVLVPAAEAEGATAPPIESVREEIRTLLRAERLNEAIEQRTEELRRRADIVYYFDAVHQELPPLLFEVERSAGGQAGGRGE